MLYKCFKTLLSLSLTRFSTYYAEMWRTHTQILWIYLVLCKPAITNWAVFWISDNMSRDLLPAIMSSICSRAASNIWLAFDAMATHRLIKKQEILTHWYDWNDWGWEMISSMAECCRLLLFLVALKSFYSKTLSDFQVNNLLNVAFGFKLSSHFVTRALPIVSSVIHKKAELIFRIVCYSVFSVCLCIFLLYKRYLWIISIVL